MNREKRFRNHQSPRRDNAPSSISIKNDFIPYDLKSLIHKSINKSNASDYNFAVIFRYPNALRDSNGGIKIRINDNLDIFEWEPAFLNQINIRLKNSVDKLVSAGFKKQSFSSTLSWRMTIGLSAYHPQETSMTLHHIYGIPYIPGSAVKGVTRHWVILKLFEKSFNTSGLPFEQIKCFEKILETADVNNKDEDKRDDKLSKEEFQEKFKAKSKENTFIIPHNKLYDFLKNQKAQKEKIIKFQKIFGTQSNKGEVIFFDAYPIGEVKLKIDVMTPHYGPYYSDASGETHPADYYNPMPIKFLTVEKTKFEFHLASKSNDLL